MSLALSMICVRMVNDCCFGDLLMSEVLPARDSGMAKSDPLALGAKGNIPSGYIES